MVEPVVVASYPSTLLDEPDPSPGVKRKADSGNKSTGRSSRRWGKGSLFKRTSSDQELAQRPSSGKGKAKKDGSSDVHDGRADTGVDSTVDGGGAMGLEASSGGADLEDGERVKLGDIKKLAKQNKELLRQNDQLTKLVSSLKHERDSLSAEKNKLKSDLKSAEKELKKAGSNLSVSRAEVERMKHHHKLPKQHSSATAEEVSELQQTVQQLETQLVEKNEKLGSLRRKLGSHVERLENQSRSMSSPELLESREQGYVTEGGGYLETKLQSEQETNARMSKENTELQTQITTLKRDLQQLQQQQQQQKDEEKGKKKVNIFKKTPSTSSLKEQQAVETVIPTTFSADAIAGAYSELSARFAQHESPFFSPKNSPSLLRKNQNHMALDGPILQACLKLSLEEKKVLEQERESLKNDLKTVQSQLEQAQEVHSCEKQDLLRQLQKAHTEREEMAREMEAVKLQNSVRTSSQEKGVITDTLKEEKSVLKEEGRKLATEQKLLQLNNGSSPPDGKRTSPGQLVHKRSASSTNEANRERQPATKRLSWSADNRQLAQRRNSNPTATTLDKISTTRSEGSSVFALEQGTEDNKPEDNGKSSRPRTNTPTGRRTLLAEKGKERSRENFAAARAKFLGNSGVSPPDVPLQRERNSSSTSSTSSTSTSDAVQSSVSTGSVSASRQTSLESPQQATVVLGKPPVHPSTTSTQSTRQPKTQEEPNSPLPLVSSKTAAKAKRMTWRVADRRRSFEEQSKDPPSSPSIPSHFSKTASSPAMTRQSSSSSSVVAETECNVQKQRSLEAEEEKKRKAQSEREKEEKNRRERQKREEEERERQRKKEEERKKQQELEEKRKKELAEKERLSKEKEEKERQRKEEEERRKRELEEKKKRDAEERERVRKEMEEKRKRAAEEKKAREVEEKERQKREREEKEKHWKKELEERRRKEEAEKQKQLEQLKRQEQEKQKQLQMRREQEKQKQLQIQREREKQKQQREQEEQAAAVKRQEEEEKQAAAVKRQEEEECQKQFKKEKEQQLKRAKEEQEKKKEDSNQTSFSSVAQRRQAFEQKSPNTSPTAVVLRRNISRPPAQRPKSMDCSSLVPDNTQTTSSTTPSLQNGSSKLSSISVKTSKSPVASPLLNQRKEIKEIAVQRSITKPPPPASLPDRSSMVAIVTTSSSPPLRRAHTLSTCPTWKSSLASSTPDLTSVVSSSGNSSSASGSSGGGGSGSGSGSGGGSGGGSGWSAATKTSPFFQRRNPPSPSTPTELWTPSNPLRSPVAEKKTKSVSFSPVVSTAGGSGVNIAKPAPPTYTSKPAPPSCTSTPPAGMQPEKLIFKASPAKLSLPESSDMKRATSLQNIPENTPTSTTVQAPVFTVGGTTAPRVNRRPRSERPNTTSLSRADSVNLVNLISKMQGKEKGPGLGNKAGLGSGFGNGLGNGLGIGSGSGGGSTSNLSSSSSSLSRSSLSRSSSNLSNTNSSVGPMGGTSLGRPMSMYGTTSPSRMDFSTPPGRYAQKPHPHERKLARRSTVAAGLDKTSKRSLLLRWCRVVTVEYDNITIEDFSRSFSSGLAFCAILHHFIPDKIPYNTLDANNRERNFTIAFEAAEEAGIPSLLELESSIGEFTAESHKDPKMKTLKNLTYEDVYWASKIENPLFSEEEIAQLQSGAWENPTFENMDQLMDERFSFLDFNEYNTEAEVESGMGSARSSELPHGSPSRRKSSSGMLGGQSPLAMSGHSFTRSPGEPRKPRHDYSPRPRLSNGLLDTYYKGHSREGSSASSDGAPSPRPTDQSMLPST